MAAAIAGQGLPILPMAMAGTGQVSPTRDVELAFTGWYERFSTSTSGFKIKVNNTEVARFTKFQNALEQQRSVIINRNHFVDGQPNTITIEPIINFYDWGVKNVQIEYLPMVSLNVNADNPGEYGYYQNPTRYTGVRGNFNLPAVPNENRILSMSGWDIDRDDETEVFFKGELVGFLNPGRSSAYSPRSEFVITPAMMRVGANTVELVQRRPHAGVWEGEQFEKWAVINIRLDSPQVLPPPPPLAPRLDFMPAMYLLLQD